MDKELGEIRERRIVSVRAAGGRTAGPGWGVSYALTYEGRLWGEGEDVPPPPYGQRVWMARSFELGKESYCYRRRSPSFPGLS